MTTSVSDSAALPDPPLPDPPIPDFPATGRQANDPKAQQRAGSRALRDLMRPVSGRLALARVLAAISGALAVVPYVALVNIGVLLVQADESGTGVDEQAIDRWIVLLLATFGMLLLTYFVALVVTHIADIDLGHSIRSRLVTRLARVPLSWFTSTNSGRVRKALQDDIGTIHHLIAHQPVDGTNAVVMPVALMVYAFVIDWRLGLLAIATIPLYVVAVSLSVRGMGAKTVEMDERLATVSARMVEFVTGIAVVKAFGRVGRAHGAYRRAAAEFHEFYLAWVTPLIRVSSLGSSILAVPLLLLITIGGGSVLVHQDSVSAADVLATALIALLVPYAIETLMNSTWAAQVAGASALRLVALVNTPVMSSAAGAPDIRSHDVTFDQVSYSYGDDASLAVDDISFTLPAGTVTALIGPSGSGKSTIATLLARFDDPHSGEIRIGGRRLDTIGALYTHVGFVLQDPQLSGITLRDNITLGRPDASEAEVRSAAAAAEILDEIDALPDGFDTVFGAGSGLSGGQAQRIAIARALLIDAPILVLDEATALTDPESEHRIQRALSTLVRGKTVLVIAHRPEVITGVDQIIVVESGRVTAVGTHEELATTPTYARLRRNAAVSTDPEGATP